MEQIERGLVTRHELALRLRQLASQWERGEVELGTLKAAVPELAEAELTLAVHADQVRLAIAVRWSPESAHRLA